MSTIDPSLIEAGAAYTADSVNTAVTGVTDGYNALDTGDLLTAGFGVAHTHPAAISSLWNTNNWTNHSVPASPASNTGVYPGHGNGDIGAGTDYTEMVTSAGPYSVLAAGAGFQVGPASPQKVGCVIVGVTAWATAGPSPGSVGSLAYLAIGVKHSGNANTQVIADTEFPINAVYTRGTTCIEYLITADDVPAGESLEEVWLVGCANNGAGDILEVTFGQIWAIALHSEG